MSDMLRAISLRLLVIVPIYTAVHPAGALRGGLLTFGLLNVCSAIESDHWKRRPATAPPLPPVASAPSAYPSVGDVVTQPKTCDCFPHGPAEPCTCTGCWACAAAVVGCTCDIAWDCEHRGAS